MVCTHSFSWSDLRLPVVGALRKQPLQGPPRLIYTRVLLAQRRTLLARTRGPRKRSYVCLWWQHNLPAADEAEGEASLVAKFEERRSVHRHPRRLREVLRREECCIPLGTLLVLKAEN